MLHRITTKIRPRPSRSKRRGAMIIVVMLAMVVLLVMTVLAVDVAYMQLVRTELRTAADAASRAGTEALARTQSVKAATDAALDTASKNLVAGKPLKLSAGDIEFGSALAQGNGSFTFSPGIAPVNSVRVLGRRTADSPSGSVDLFLGGIMNQPTFSPEAPAISTSVVRDISLVLDRSGSMKRNNKIGDLKVAVNVFLNVLESTRAEERVSLASYSTTGTKDVNMTSRFDRIRSVVNGMPARGTTAIGQGLAIGKHSLFNDRGSRAFSEKVIVLLTDGIENRAPTVRDVMPDVLSANIKVFTITFGSGADQSLMRKVARATGGQHFHAPTGDALKEIFETVAESLAVVMIE